MAEVLQRVKENRDRLQHETSYTDMVGNNNIDSAIETISKVERNDKEYKGANRFKQLKENGSMKREDIESLKRIPLQYDMGGSEAEVACEHEKYHYMVDKLEEEKETSMES